MNNRHGRLPVIFMFLCLQLLPVIACADNISVSNSGVFKFQQKMSESGNVQSQYKLATMYELGIGTKQNLEQAREWYAKALDNGAVEAKDRLVYLEIRQNGYSNKSHGLWVTKTKKDAASGNQHALMLIGQMYSNGIGVKKDLYKAKKQLGKVDEMQTPLVIYEIERVEAEIEKADNAWRAKKAQKRKQEEKRKQEARKKAQIENAKKQKTEKAEPEKVEVVADSRQQDDEVMRDIQEDDVLKQQGVQDWFE